jgi:hypothetical protein
MFNVFFFFTLITRQCSCLKIEAVWDFRKVGTHRQSIVYRDRLSDLRNIQQKYFYVFSLCWYKCHFKEQHLILLPLQWELREHAQRRKSRTLLPPSRSAHKARVPFTAALHMKHPVSWEQYLCAPKDNIGCSNHSHSPTCVRNLHRSIEGEFIT